MADTGFGKQVKGFVDQGVGKLKKNTTNDPLEKIKGGLQEVKGKIEEGVGREESHTDDITQHTEEDI